MKHIVVLTILSGLLLTSCAVAEFETEQAAVGPSSSRIQTRSTMGELSKKDSLRLIYKFQTDKRALLHNYTLHKDGEYRLGLSRERATSLGVSPELYDEYVKYLNKVNER